MKTYNYKYLIGILGAIIIFVSIGIVSYINLDKDENAGSDAAFSYDILNTLKEVENGDKDISLARRGYIMSGDRIFLETFQPVKSDIREKLLKLDVLTKGDMPQNRNIEMLRTILYQKIALAETSASLYMIKSEYDINQQMVSASTIVLNFVLIRLFKEIEDYQRSLLQQKVEDEAFAEKLTRQFIVGGNIIAFMMILASILVARKKSLQKLRETEVRKGKESELRNKQTELELLVNIMPVGVYYVDDAENCTFVNDSWCKMTGYMPADVYGTSIVNIVHPGDRERTFTSFLKAIDTGTNFHDEYRYVCKNGEIKYIIGQATARKNADGRIIGFIGSVIDMTKQHIYQEELVKFNTLFESIAEGIPDPIFVKDIDGKYEFINSSAAKMIGKDIEDIIGKNDFDVFSETVAKETIERDKLVYEAKCNINYEVTSVMPDGLIKTFLSTKGILHNSKNKPVGLFGILRDITSMKENETQIKRSLAEKETLLRETHHRVKNNLQIVASLLRLQSGYIKDEESKHFFLDSQNRIKTIAVLHEKLYGSEKYSHVDIKRYVEQLMEILVTSFGIDQNRIKITTDIEEMDIDIEYSVPIGLVINEIITNSFKYAFDENQRGEIFINIRKMGEELMINIGDNGKGLSEELDVRNLKSLGLQLIFTLIEGQLAGKVKFLPSDKGLVFGITIPMKVPVLEQI
ncbi:MAG: PAS domain S-box protein [Ignavibacteria bacterium]